MSTDKGCAPGKSSLIGLGSARDYDVCAILQDIEKEEFYAERKRLQYFF